VSLKPDNLHGLPGLRVTRPKPTIKRNETIMSIDTKLAQALTVLEPTAEAILKNRGTDFTDQDIVPFQPLLDFPMRKVLASYEGTNSFLMDLRRKPNWTNRQARAVANIMRRELRGENSKFGTNPNNPVAPRNYTCYYCNEVLVGLDALYDHQAAVHQKGKRYRGEQVGSNGPVETTHFGAPTGPMVPVLPDYKPELNIDLRTFLPGRFAIEDKTGTLRFFIITELKRRTRLWGKFVWTKYAYANEYLEKGDRTVREQAGDTKKFIGKQRINQPVYFGEEEALIKMIADNPTEAMIRYGKELHRCGYCGKSLTDELSRERGIGPDCWENKHIPQLIRLGVAAAKAATP